MVDNNVVAWGVGANIKDIFVVVLVYYYCYFLFLIYLFFLFYFFYKTKNENWNGRVVRVLGVKPVTLVYKYLLICSLG